MITKRIEELEKGCGKVLTINTDYDGKIVICGKYGKILCLSCQAKLNLLKELKAEIEKEIDKLLEKGLNGKRYNFMINGEELKQKLIGTNEEEK